MNGRSLGLVVVAAGLSQRMNRVDKIWANLDDQPVLWHAVSALYPLADSTVVVVRDDYVERARAVLSEFSRNLAIVSGGAHRQESVRRGLDELSDVEVIAVHDAARPFASATLLKAGLSLLDEFDGAIPVLPLGSTIKMVDSTGTVTRTVDRSTLRAAQTPQLFRADALRTAHDLALRSRFVGTDCACLLERFGGRVGTFEGSPTNFKITTPFDLELARLLLRQATVS